jgi:membrane protein implicated in regulation of membrane protease activity
MIWEYILSLGAWNWFVLAAVLFGIEIIAPGTFVLWLGFSAVAVGLISLAVEWPWQAQVVTFAVLSVVAIVLWRRIARKVEAEPDRPFLNRRADALVGRIFKLDRPIVDGVGAVRIGDTVWRVMGPDCPAGSEVQVTRVEGADLRVERMAAH